MKALFATVGLIAITSLGSGCSGLAKTARALAQDQAIVIVEVGTVIINPKK